LVHKNIKNGWTGPIQGWRQTYAQMVYYLKKECYNTREMGFKSHKFIGYLLNKKERANFISTFRIFQSVELSLQ
jgi:hypothetical protein